MRYFTLLILTTTLILAGCSSSSTSTTPADTTLPANTYASLDKAFTMVLNENFVFVEKQQLSNGTVFAAVDLANEKNAITPNINVVKTALTRDFPIYFFAKANIKKAKEVISDYKSLNEEDITIDDQKTMLHEFTSGGLHYIQTYLIKNGFSYTITSTVYQDADSSLIKDYTGIIKSFAFIKPKAADTTKPAEAAK